MSSFFLLICSVTTIAVVFVVVVLWRTARKRLEARRARQLATLESYNKRLRIVVDGLLARADQIDQEQKYLPQAIDSDASKRFGKTCGDLVTLAESLKLIESQLQSGDIRESRQSLLQCCRVAAHAARELEAARESGNPAE